MTNFITCANNDIHSHSSRKHFLVSFTSTPFLNVIVFFYYFLFILRFLSSFISSFLLGVGKCFTRKHVFNCVYNLEICKRNKEKCRNFGPHVTLPIFYLFFLFLLLTDYVLQYLSKSRFVSWYIVPLLISFLFSSSSISSIISFSCSFFFSLLFTPSLIYNSFSSLSIFSIMYMLCKCSPRFTQYSERRKRLGNEKMDLHFLACLKTHRSIVWLSWSVTRMQ